MRALLLVYFCLFAITTLTAENSTRPRGPMRDGDMPLFPPNTDAEARTRGQLGRHSGIMVIPKRGVEATQALAQEGRLAQTEWDTRMKKKRLFEFSLEELNYLRSTLPSHHKQFLDSLVKSGDINQFGQSAANYIKVFAPDHWELLKTRLETAGLPTQFEEEWILDPRAATCLKSLEAAATH